MRALKFAMLAAACVAGVQTTAPGAAYRGFPHLHLTMAVVDAGGGGKDFDSHRLVQRLAGPQAAAENAKLVAQYGGARVDAFYNVFTFAIDDAVKRAHNSLIPLPKSPHPDPNDGRALATALYDAGVTRSGRFDVGHMLEVLASHQIQHNIMGDMDEKYTQPVNADFHKILTSLMQDLRREYAITPPAGSS